MGYTTEFKGVLKFDTPLTKDQVNYIQAFCATRRMKRDAAKAEQLKDDLRLAVGLPIGLDGGFYVGSYQDGNAGQTHDKTIIEYNDAPGSMGHDITDFYERYGKNKQLVKEGKAQPGLWCQWAVNDEGTELEWNGGEKFYNYVEWLKYLINNFFEVWGKKLNGSIRWRGEDFDDMGTIEVKDNNVTII